MLEVFNIDDNGNSVNIFFNNEQNKEVGVYFTGQKRRDFIKELNKLFEKYINMEYIDDDINDEEIEHNVIYEINRA